MATAKAKAAAKAVAEGRVPGQRGQPSKCTPEQKREKQRLRVKKYRDENLERVRAYHREYERKRAAEQAIAEGRVPGVSGAPRKFKDDAEARAKQTARTKDYYHRNLEKVRKQAADRERAKRAAIKAGTFVPKPQVSRTLAERRARVNAEANNRRAMKLANGGTYTADDIRTLRRRQNGLCPCCNRLLGEHNLHVDHWVPLIRGGHNSVGNLAILHGLCNLAKGKSHPSELGLNNEPLAA